MRSDRPRLLIADDEERTRMVLDRLLGRADYDRVLVGDGQEAWDAIQADPSGFDAILLDVNMPRMTGIDVLAHMKTLPELRGVPAIMQTGAHSTEDVIRGLSAGAYYYLTKPYEPGVLLAVVATAIEEHRRFRALKQEVEIHREFSPLLTGGEFELRTIHQARLLATVLAGAFPDPARVVVGLIELLVNAVEHGSLGIRYAEKSALLERGELGQEIARRMADPALAARRVTVRFRREADRITTAIEDEGGGFDWRAYLDYDPERAFDPNGRGIAIAREMSFDELVYNELGNAVTATVKLGEKDPESGELPVSLLDPAPRERG